MLEPINFDTSTHKNQKYIQKIELENKQLRRKIAELTEEITGYRMYMEMTEKEWDYLNKMPGLQSPNQSVVLNSSAEDKDLGIESGLDSNLSTNQIETNEEHEAGTNPGDIHVAEENTENTTQVTDNTQDKTEVSQSSKITATATIDDNKTKHDLSLLTDALLKANDRVANCIKESDEIIDQLDLSCTLRMTLFCVRWTQAQATGDLKHGVIF